MDKIRLGKTDMMVSRIGFGGIPIQLQTEDEAIGTIRRSLALGINYFDTSDNYGTSEARIGKAIANRKNKPFVATKVGSQTKEVESHLANSRKALGVDSIDVYQFHNVSDFGTLKSILAPNGALAVLQKAKKAGEIKHIGISSHQIDVAKEAIKSGQFETIMYPFNFITCEAAEELINLAADYDLGFIAMKPFAGGRIKNIAVAVKYLLQFPNVMVLPGIGNASQIEQIVDILKSPQLTPEEQRIIQQTRDKMSSRICRHCDECLPCPQNVAVSYVLDFEPLSMGFPGESFYSGPMAAAMAVAATCDNCGQCETRCPYNIPVRAMLAEYVRKFDSEKKKFLK